ncbi:hypothetical protein Tco_0734897 [Tanacetum coccineum]
MGLWYSKDTDMSLTAYADAYHVGCQDTRRSTLGSAQFLGDTLVSWSSKKQKSTAISSIEAEYIALSGAKHIDIRYHLIKEQVENGIMELYFVRTEYQLADHWSILTDSKEYLKMVMEVLMEPKTALGKKYKKLFQMNDIPHAKTGNGRVDAVVIDKEFVVIDEESGGKIL